MLSAACGVASRDPTFTRYLLATPYSAAADPPTPTMWVEREERILHYFSTKPALLDVRSVASFVSVRDLAGSLMRVPKS